MNKLFAFMESALAVLGRLPARKLAVAAACLVGVEAVCLLAYAAQTHRVVQHGRAFDVPQITIAAGDTIEFSNEDDFIHQIYVQSSQLNFDSDEQPPGQVITLKFPTAGTYDVRCHIHPKMDLKVNVQ